MTAQGGPDAAALVTAHSTALFRLASFAHASDAEIDDAIVAAARAASGSSPADARAVLFRALAVRVAELERAAGGPEASESPAVASDRFEPVGSRWEGWFRDDPPSLRDLDRGEMSKVAQEALAGLPVALRVVVVLGDIAGWDPEEVRSVLGIDEEFRRALLHSGRNAVRGALERLAQEHTGG